ncbi:uncharacterized protein LOC124535308 isoform X1 [Vanessa cardui]|uniref:uncharacterized protein LOC124535308 isoform X1 n=1 Tax=Vanessa cardui TaxID=171605 RepID=UPI001F13F004|nr:uncharacterized protein LOC124535308 isoform X1 [Vanessa cardui]
MKIAVFAVFIICSVVAIDEIAAQKNLMESNGTPLLQIPNFEDTEQLKKNIDQRLFKRSAESSSKSEEELDDKVVEVLKDNIKQARESELSDEVDSSADVADSGGDRRISTKGFLHDVFERESNPKIHGRYSKESEE